MFYSANQDDCDTNPKQVLTPEQKKAYCFLHRMIRPIKRFVMKLSYCWELDLDFKNRQINIDRLLLRNTEIGCYIEVPKTKSGIRQLPMTEEVYQAFQQILKNRLKPDPIVIDRII